MELTASLARQLRDLHRSEDFALALGELAAGLATAVPSLVTVSLVVLHQGVPVPVIVKAEPDGGPVVLASLAVELAGRAGCLLILQAAETGAFLLLRDELVTSPAGQATAPQVDQHLSPTPPPGQALTSARARLAAVDRAVGVLLDRGLLPEAALEELRRRAEIAGTELVAAAHALLAELDPAD
jgi:hypothetical protein